MNTEKTIYMCFGVSWHDNFVKKKKKNLRDNVVYNTGIFCTIITWYYMTDSEDIFKNKYKTHCQWVSHLQSCNMTWDWKEWQNIFVQTIE